MPYLQQISDNQNNPQQLEALFQAARGSRAIDQFAADLNACYAGQPDNLLLQAWHYRLQSTLEEPRRREGVSANWKLAVPLAILNGLTLGVLAAPGLTFINQLPWLVLLAAPITVGFVIAFVALTARQHNRRSLAVGAGLALLAAAAILITYRAADQALHGLSNLERGASGLAGLGWGGRGAGGCGV